MLLFFFPQTESLQALLRFFGVVRYTNGEEQHLGVQIRAFSIKFTPSYRQLFSNMHYIQ